MLKRLLIYRLDALNANKRKQKALESIKKGACYLIQCDTNLDIGVLREEIRMNFEVKFSKRIVQLQDWLFFWPSIFSRIP